MPTLSLEYSERIISANANAIALLTVSWIKVKIIKKFILDSSRVESSQPSIINAGALEHWMIYCGGFVAFAISE